MLELIHRPSGSLVSTPFTIDMWHRICLYKTHLFLSTDSHPDEGFLTEMRWYSLALKGHSGQNTSSFLMNLSPIMVSIKALFWAGAPPSGSYG